MGNRKTLSLVIYHTALAFNLLEPKVGGVIVGGGDILS